YEMCREHYPKLFERILQAIRDGQWIADGAMWVEPDTNLPSGESLVRQFLYGMRYFSQKLGVTAQTAWLPDTFGYSAALPQILAGFGLKGLTTQKIFWSYNDSESFPYHAFQWKGLDGTAIPCYLHMQYESFVDAKTLCRRWRERVCKDGSGDFLLPFGYGDGGGGPTRDDFEQIRREKDLQGVPKMRYEAPSDFFDTRKDMPAYCGELYFPCHRGTYTTQAAIKQRNRQSENALRSLELWAACAAWKGLREYPAQTIEKLWKELLLNQFHDILPGSGIHEVYVEAHRRYDALLSGARKETDAAQACIAGEEEGVTLFHAQSCARRQVVALDARFAQGAMTREGDVIPCTMAKDQALALLTLPPMGHLSLRPWKTDAPARQVFVEKNADGYRLRNDCMEAVLNLRGELV
ncbi:MAG: alpha-mannosidase, partial [Clostridia bacterium]|nr:alpha-mannosidase [Clostridia bacterium]